LEQKRRSKERISNNVVCKDKKRDLRDKLERRGSFKGGV